MAALLASPAELAARRKRGLAFVKSFPTEEEMGRRVEELIKNRVRAKHQERSIEA